MISVSPIGTWVTGVAVEVGFLRDGRRVTTRFPIQAAVFTVGIGCLGEAPIKLRRSHTPALRTGPR